VRASADSAVDEVLEFLGCRTPDCWFRAAAAELDVLLIDHANCEKKAAGTALSLLYRYVDRPELLKRMSRLAREELRHFEQVQELMARRGIRYRHLSSSRYAAGLRECVRGEEPQRLVDTLLVGAVVEARSCERFLGLTEVLDAELAAFYARLLESEARHFRHYLELAERYAESPLEAQLQRIKVRDQQLVTEPDGPLRFHSGPPAESTRAQAPVPAA
jgi:tRNA-(ms[2]io[6]A)-hydroxylase